jgi:hypothetical protein
MKKTFVNPEMNISLFDMENVVTASAGGSGSGTDTPATKTNTELAKDAIGSDVTISTIDWAF